LHEITRTDYRQFLHSHPEVVIGETKIKLHPNWKISQFVPFTPEITTVFRFPDRGDWATHVGNYRGNWSPYIPRNLILRYTAPGEFMLNPARGGASAGVWGNNPSAVKIMLTEIVDSMLICGFFFEISS